MTVCGRGRSRTGAGASPQDYSEPRWGVRSSIERHSSLRPGMTRDFPQNGGAVALVAHTKAKQCVGVERSPMSRIFPHASHALTRIQHKATRGPGPHLRGRHFTHRPLHAMPVQHDVRSLLVVRTFVGGEDMTLCIFTPGHQSTYGCAGGISSRPGAGGPCFSPSTHWKHRAAQTRVSIEFPDVRCPVTASATGQAF